MRHSILGMGFALLLCAAASAVAGSLPCSCPADFNVDGVVDGGDLGLLLTNWDGLGGDLNGNGTTDGADLGILLAAWGPCTSPLNDLCINPQTIPVGHLPQFIPFCTVQATSSGPGFALGTCGDLATDLSKDVWFNYSSASDGTLTVQTCGDADFDTIIAIYGVPIPGLGGCPPQQGQPGLVELLGCNDDAPNCPRLTSRLELELSANHIYKIRVGGFGGDSGSGSLYFKFDSVGDQCYHPRSLGSVVSATATGSTADNPEGIVACGFGANYSEWFVWTAPCTGFVTLSTCNPGTSYDTVLAAWRETLAGGCTAIEVECLDDALGAECELPGPGAKSRFEFVADQGTTYYIQVGGYNGASGDFEFSLDLDCI